MDYWQLFSEKSAFISKHIQHDGIVEYKYLGRKYTMCPVYACPIVTGEQESAIVNVTWIISVEEANLCSVVYICYALNRSEERHCINLNQMFVTMNGPMVPEDAVPFGDILLKMVPDMFGWSLHSMHPVMEGKVNAELYEQ